MAGGLVGLNRIMKAIQQKSVAATTMTMNAAADRAIEEILNDVDFFSVTGNAYTSISAGVYYKGTLIHVATVARHAKEPLRPSIRAGETWVTKEFYDKSPTPLKKYRYKGKYGRGGQWGPTLGTWWLKRLHPAKRKTWEIVIIIPVSYAKYNPKIVGTMQKMMDALPVQLDSSLVRVETV